MPRFVDPIVPAGRLSGSAQPEIPVDELVLRPWRATDAPAVVEAYRDSDIQRWHVRSMTEQEALAWVLSSADRWAAEIGAGWAIEAGGVLVGRMDLSTLDLAEGTGHAAYWVVPRARGRGIATRALQAVTAWMFTQVGLHRIEVEHSTRNEASCRVLVKARFAIEGTKQNSALHADGWHHMHQHARINDTAGSSTLGVH